MNPLDSRVTKEQDFLVLDPPHPTPAKMMVKALRNDMEKTAMLLRDAFYDLSENETSLSIMLKIIGALDTLDFSHYIPIPNTSDSLYLEYVTLQESVAWSHFDDEQYEENIAKLRDIENELERRDFWDEIVLEDMTAVVLDIEIKASTPEDCPYPNHCPTKGCAGECNPPMQEVDNCESHFLGGWYYTTDNQLKMAVPPHEEVDKDNFCPKCRGWLSYPKNFSHWRNEGGK